MMGKWERSTAFLGSTLEWCCHLSVAQMRHERNLDDRVLPSNHQKSLLFPHLKYSVSESFLLPSILPA